MFEVLPTFSRMAALNPKPISIRWAGLSVRFAHQAGDAALAQRLHHAAEDLRLEALDVDLHQVHSIDGFLFPPLVEWNRFHRDRRRSPESSARNARVGHERRKPGVLRRHEQRSIVGSPIAERQFEDAHPVLQRVPLEVLGELAEPGGFGSNENTRPDGPTRPAASIEK